MINNRKKKLETDLDMEDVYLQWQNILGEDRQQLQQHP
jgi:hypothetical protein